MINRRCKNHSPPSSPEVKIIILLPPSKDTLRSLFWLQSKLSVVYQYLFFFLAGGNPTQFNNISRLNPPLHISMLLVTEALFHEHYACIYAPKQSSNCNVLGHSSISGLSRLWRKNCSHHMWRALPTETSVKELSLHVRCHTVGQLFGGGGGIRNRNFRPYIYIYMNVILIIEVDKIWKTLSNRLLQKKCYTVNPRSLYRFSMNYTQTLLDVRIETTVTRN
jgi:hypothetical protein